MYFSRALRSVLTQKIPFLGLSPDFCRSKTYRYDMPTGSLILFLAITKNVNTIFYFRQWWMSRNNVTDRNCVWLLSQLYGVLQLQLQPEEINPSKPDAFTRAARFDTWNPGFRPQVYLHVTTFLQQTAIIFQCSVHRGLFPMEAQWVPS